MWKGAALAPSLTLCVHVFVVQKPRCFLLLPQKPPSTLAAAFKEEEQKFSGWLEDVKQSRFAGGASMGRGGGEEDTEQTVGKSSRWGEEVFEQGTNMRKE